MQHLFKISQQQKKSYSNITKSLLQHHKITLQHARGVLREQPSGLQPRGKRRCCLQGRPTPNKEHLPYWVSYVGDGPPPRRAHAATTEGALGLQPQHNLSSIPYHVIRWLETSTTSEVGTRKLAASTAQARCARLGGERGRKHSGWRSPIKSILIGRLHRNITIT